MGEFFAEAGMIYLKRRDTYRDAWMRMSLEELAAGLRLKAGRITAMIEDGCPREKILDDLYDIANYAAMLYLKLVPETVGAGAAHADPAGDDRAGPGPSSRRGEPGSPRPPRPREKAGPEDK